MHLSPAGRPLYDVSISHTLNAILDLQKRRSRQLDGGLRLTIEFIVYPHDGLACDAVLLIR